MLFQDPYTIPSGQKATDYLNMGPRDAMLSIYPQSAMRALGRPDAATANSPYAHFANAMYGGSPMTSPAQAAGALSGQRQQAGSLLQRGLLGALGGAGGAALGQGAGLDPTTMAILGALLPQFFIK